MRSAIEIADGVRAGRIRASDVLAEVRPLVERSNPGLVAFVHLDWDLAEQEARRIDAHVERGEPVGPLAGVPFGVKDLDDCAGMPTSHGSLIFKGSAPETVDSPHVARLRAAGAIPIGKTAPSEFGMDSA